MQILTSQFNDTLHLSGIEHDTLATTGSVSSSASAQIEQLKNENAQLAEGLCRSNRAAREYEQRMRDQDKEIVRLMLEKQKPSKGEQIYQIMLLKQLYEDTQ